MCTALHCHIKSLLRIVCLLATLCAMALCAVPAQAKNNLKAVLDSLDNSVQNKEVFVNQKERKIKEIKEALSLANLNDLNLYTIYNQLQNEYYKFQQDSAIHYAQLCVEVATRMNDRYRTVQSDFMLAMNFAMHGQYRQSKQILDKYNLDNVPRDLRPDYYQANIQYLQYFMYTSTLPEDEALMRAYRDSLYATQDKTSSEYKFNEVMRMNSGERLEAYKRLLNDVEKGSPIYARITHEIGSIEVSRGNMDEAKIYLSRSALADLYNVTRENQSIFELAQVFYADGDYVRAYKYAQSSFADAILAGIQFRVTLISEFFSMITDVYQQREAQSKHWLILILVFSAILMCFLAAAILFIFKQLQKNMRIRQDLAENNTAMQQLNDKLAEMNSRLHNSNSQLQENNSIKEQYIAQFFNICSGYIDRLGDFQRELYKLAVNKHFDELVKKLRSTTLIEEEIETLYHHFDTIFLNLYPTFVSDINNMLRDEEKIVLKPGTLLNKELRIYALLRLGITDSEKIASFLHCSISTIYNYRTKMRNKANDGKTSFESRVLSIGAPTEQPQPPRA